MTSFSFSEAMITDIILEQNKNSLSLFLWKGLIIYSKYLVIHSICHDPDVKIHLGII
jgi:hypothetical protein